MRITTVLLSMMVLGCTHAPKEDAAAPRTPAAQKDAEGVSRTPLAVTSTLGKALVMTISQERTLVFETCTLDTNSLARNEDIMRVLNSGAVDCVNLNATTFDATDLRTVDAIFRQFVEEQKSIVTNEVAMSKVMPLGGSIFLGIAAINFTAISYGHLRGRYDTYYPGKVAGKIVARSLGVLGGLFDVVLIGATAAAADNARIQFESSKPATIEVAMEEYAISRKNSPNQAPFTSGEFFNIVVRAMRRSTSRIDYKLRSL